MIKEIIVQPTAKNKLGYISRENRRVVLTGDIIISRSGRSLFDVFEENITTGRPEPIPRISNGNVVLFEKDGIVRVNGTQVELPHESNQGFSITARS